MSQHGTFIWADLSTFRPSITTAFYGSLFGWSFADAGAQGGKDGSMDGGAAGYTLATAKADPVAALYPMPQTFVDMGMPSFWMSYIAVDDVAACAALARDLGARVELGPAPFGNPNASAKDGGEDGGTYALIRDPLGAGFTVYQGPDFAPDTTGQRADQNGTPNTRQGHALFVSDAQAVIPFYQALFGWDFAPLTSDSWAITSAKAPTADGALAHLYEIPDPRVRGREEYWAVLFNGPVDAAQVASKLGGSHVADIDLHEGSVQVIADPDGGTFMVLPNGAARAATVGDAPRNATTTPPAKWKAWTGLALIALSVMTGWSWISALFFALWAVMGIRDRATFLLEPVERADTPLLYWLIIGSFAGLSPLILLYG